MKTLLISFTFFFCGGVTAQVKSTLIHNVWLIDGSGKPAVKSAVRIEGKQIRDTGNLSPLPGETVINGNGMILAPGFIDSHSHHYGDLRNHPDGLPAINQGITTIVIGQDGHSLPMDTLDTFIRRRPVALNIASYTGHSTLRENSMGEKDLFRTATEKETREMKDALEAELRKGSLGLSTGLEYEEGFYSSKQEVLTLAKVAATQKARYISHIRSEDITLDDAVDEIIEIGRQTGMPVQLSHIKIALKDRWQTSAALLKKLDAARAAGIDITADVYPYTFWNSTLRVLFPKRDYENPESAQFAVTQLFDPTASVLAEFAPYPAYKGKTLSAVAKERNETEAQTLMNLIRMAAEFDAAHPAYQGGIEAIVAQSMHEEDVTKFILWPHSNICSDGYRGGHPRGMGAFPRVLARYVRERKLLTWEEAIHKMTALSAAHLGLSQRGIIAKGYYADLVLFDPATVEDKADIRNPQALSAGILKVWVNGVLVFQEQQATGHYPGELLKRTN